MAKNINKKEEVKQEKPVVENTGSPVEEKKEEVKPEAEIKAEVKVEEAPVEEKVEEVKPVEEKVEAKVEAPAKKESKSASKAVVFNGKKKVNVYATELLTYIKFPFYGIKKGIFLDDEDLKKIIWHGVRVEAVNEDGSATILTLENFDK